MNGIIILSFVFLFTIAIIWMLSKIAKACNQALDVTTTGMLFFIMGLFVGVPLFIYGVGIVIATIYFTAISYDATGLGIIVGPPIAALGCLFLLCFIPAVHWLKPNAKGKKMMIVAISFVALVVLCFVMKGFVAYKWRNDAYFKKQERTRERYKSERKEAVWEAL